MTKSILSLREFLNIKLGKVIEILKMLIFLPTEKILTLVLLKPKIDKANKCKIRFLECKISPHTTCSKFKNPLLDLILVLF